MKRFWIVLLVAPTLLFVGLSALVHWRVTPGFDRAALDAAQSAFPRAVDLPFSVLSLLGSAEITSAIFLAVVFFLARPPQRAPLIAAFGAMTLIELVGKTFLTQPIVPHNLVRTIHLFSIPSGKIGTIFSYPSGHSARTAFLSVMLVGILATRDLPRAIRVALYAMLAICAALMFVSRIYLAEHWTTDVLGGALLGALFALIPFWIEKKNPLSRLGRKAG